GDVNQVDAIFRGGSGRSAIGAETNLRWAHELLRLLAGLFGALQVPRLHTKFFTGTHFPLVKLEIASAREQRFAVGCESNRSDDTPEAAVAIVNVRQREAMDLAAGRPIPEAHTSVRGRGRQ